jgi:arylsulfatase A-like enzyme
MSIIRSAYMGLLAMLATVTIAAAPASAQQQKPNILVIMGDDIGYWNISSYNRGMMGYRTPNIDRIADEGAILTDYYGQQSCTAGRAAFITGQSPMRTGLLKVDIEGNHAASPRYATACLRTHPPGGRGSARRGSRSLAQTPR